MNRIVPIALALLSPTVAANLPAQTPRKPGSDIAVTYVAERSL